MTYPCPYCPATAELATGCPGCGRGPDPDAAEVVRLDAEIAALNARAAEARQTLAETDLRLRDTWQRRNAAAGRVRAAVAAFARAGRRVPVPAGPAPAGPAPAPSFAPPVGTPPMGTPPIAAPPAGEASSRLLQNTLFLIGGLLLGIAAIVFAAVAWSQFGVGGRAVLLAGFTVAALAVPPLALWRRLRATAETFAAVGLLLVLLDGYAAWYVNLFGVADYSAWGYAGAVCAVTAAIAAGYEHLTGLTGPKFVALVVAQPVLPLLVSPLHPDATGWSFTLSAVAALNLAVVHLRRGALTAVGVTAYAFAGLAVAAGGLSGLIGLALAETAGPAALAGAAVVTASLVVLAGAVLARSPIAQAVAAVLVVVALGLAGSNLLAAVTDDLTPILVTALLVALAVGASLLRRAVSEVVGRGLLVAGLLVLLPPALVALGRSLESGTRTVEAAQPFLGAALTARSGGADWQLPVMIVLLAGGLVALLPGRWWRHVALGAAALVALGVPGAFGLPWWSAPALDLLVTAAALALALHRTAPMSTAAASAGSVPAGAAPTGPGHATAGSGAAGSVAGAAGSGGGRADAVLKLVLSLVWLCGLAAATAVHAVVAGFGRPWVATLTLAAIALIGAGVSAAAWNGPRRADVGGGSLAAGLLAVPGAAWVFTVALSLSEVVRTRVALGAAAVLFVVAHVVARRAAGYRIHAQVAALLAVLTAPAWATATGDSAAVYAGVALVLVASTVTIGRATAAVASVPLGLAVFFGAGGGLVTVLVAPYARVAEVWDGRPFGSGLGRVFWGDVAAVALAAVAVALAVVLVRGRRAAIWYAAPVVAVAAVLGLAAGRAVWPVVPAASLLLGLAGLLVLAIRPAPAAPRVAATPATVVAGPKGLGGAGVSLGLVSVALAGAGFAGMLPVRLSTLAALGALLVAGSVAGAVARELEARLFGWLGAAASAFGFAFTAGRAAELSLPVTAFAVLGAAAVVLGVGTLLTGRRDRSVEGRAVQAAAHAGALGALLMTAGSARYAAAVCTLWGLALGVRALRPRERAVVRSVLIVAAATAELAGWCLLMAAERVSTMEVYTLPAAAVALLAGILALRSRPRLTSWVTYGPALAAAMLPALASVLVDEGQPVRRLVLGLGALGVVLAGTWLRLQAPVILGGLVLIAVALHELVLVWDLLPRWIPLAAAGLLLVALAMTLERRRRDLARVRSAITRMS